VLAHARAYLAGGQYGERRDNEQATAWAVAAWRTLIIF